MKIIKKYLIILLMSIFSLSLISGCNAKKCNIHIDSNNDGCCDNCSDEIKIICEHSWIDATCTKPKTCSKCGLTDGTAKTHNVVIDEKVEATCIEHGSTSGAHCSECNEILIKQNEIEKAEHTWSDATCSVGKTCTVCGAIGSEPNNHNAVVVKGYAATCSEKGLTDGSYCSICLKILSEQKEIEKVEHTWSDATCTNAKICTTCGLIDGIPVEHSIVIDEGYAATCINEGLTYGAHCSDCGKVLLEQVITPIADHTEVVDKGYEATCTKTGLTDGSHCLICNEVLKEQVEIPIADHTEVVDKGYEATCTETGLTDGSHCLICNEVLKEQETILSLGHDWQEATYKAPKTCKTCGATEGSKLECLLHEDKDNNGFCDKCDEKILYKSKWEANKQTGGWNGLGMIVKIYVTNVTNYDPFDMGYTASDKKILQKRIREIESAYGIDLVYENWPNSAPWGLNRINYLKQGNFDEDLYIVSIDSSWISTLVNGGCLAELATLDSEYNVYSGIFTEIGYQETYEGSGEYVPGTYLQDKNNNILVSYLNKIFGYVKDKPRPDYFMYYNADLIASVGMTDPAELWLRGEWTYSNFYSYCMQLQSFLENNQYALSLNFAEFIIGLTASTGSSIATARPSLGLTTSSVIEKFGLVQYLYSSGCYENRSSEEVSNGFLQSNVAFVNGKLWFMRDASRFNPQVCDFTIGAVPYPTADGQGGQPITTTEKDNAIRDYYYEPIELVEGSGEYISGVDMSNSSFAVPYCTTSECFSIIDTVSGKNGINNKILFAIIYDLYNGLGNDPEIEEVDEDTTYRNWLLTKFDKYLYADVIMSVQNKIYPELIENVSYIVGGGVHYSGNGFWELALNICKNPSINPATKLNEVLSDYRQAMINIGYSL